MILQSMQLLLDSFASASDGIVESGLGSNQLLVLEVAYKVQPRKDEIHSG